MKNIENTNTEIAYTNNIKASDEINASEKKPPLIILTGPTGVGKTELSIKLAKAINGEIISADSIQVYKYMDIGSAKIMPEEMQGVKHYLVDCIEPDEEFNICRFKQMATAAMKEIYSKGRIPIIVGGTGFYIQSVVYDIEFKEENNEHSVGDNGNPDFAGKTDDISNADENIGVNSVRLKYEKLALEKGNHYIHEILKKIDPESAAAIHENNVKRVIRAIEYYENTGELMSVHNKRESSKASPYDFHYFVLNRDRNVLYQRIDKRVDIMVEDGLVEEVKELLNRGYDRNLVSMQGLGYKEIVSYLNNECTLDEAVEIIKRDTRHFAKRQLTWFRREKEVVMMNYEDYDNSIDKMCQAMVDVIKGMD